MGINCVINGDGCVVCPYIPSHAAVSSYTVIDTGWDAGANSVDKFDGDIHTVFQVPASVAGVVLGFRSTRENQGDFSLNEHGFYFFSGIGGVMEGGEILEGPFSFGSGDTFEIRRYKNHVTYWRNDELVYRSVQNSYGPKIVNACLYASGDTVE